MTDVRNACAGSQGERNSQAGLNRKTIRIADAFANGKAFIPFITCGDPDLETTEALVKAAAENGPVIQEANERALKAGTTTDKVFALVARLRETLAIPLVFMTYANVVFSYGTERFLSECVRVGIQGLILPDIPFEEKAEFEPACREKGLELVSLIAPTSEERIGMIAKDAAGFVYCVSSLGVTGVRKEITTDVGAMVKLVKQAKDIPCAIGFGISTPEQARKMAAVSDGAIVGSAIMKLIAAHGRESVPYVAQYVREMKDAVRM